MAGFSGLLKKYFVSGVLVVVPLILTYIVLKFLFDTVDGILQPVIHKLFGYYIPGLGLAVTLLLILLAGILTRNYVGARIYKIGERVLSKLPIIRPIYYSAKQLLESVTGPSIKSFKEVALVEYPRKGSWSIGFISNYVEIEKDDTKQKYISIFIPSTPTPISGMVVLLPVDEVFLLEMSVEEGVKFLVSGGVACPEIIKLKRKLAQDNEGVISEIS
ncbi:MAG: DUF502 domain-containing protein [bacterium]